MKKGSDRFPLEDKDRWWKKSKQEDHLVSLPETFAQVRHHDSGERGRNVHTSGRVDHYLLSTNLSSPDCQEKWRGHHILTAFPVILQINWIRTGVYRFYHHTDHSGKHRYGSSQLLCHVWDILYAPNHFSSQQQPAEYEKKEVRSIPWECCPRIGRRVRIIKVPPRP